MSNYKLPLTPLTEETFIRQKWDKNYMVDDPDGETSDEYYYSMTIPRNSEDEYPLYLISNTNKNYEEIKEIGVLPDCYFVALADFYGLGICKTEEELEVLYKSLTGEDIENFDN